MVAVAASISLLTTPNDAPPLRFPLTASQRAARRARSRRTPRRSRSSRRRRCCCGSCEANPVTTRGRSRSGREEQPLPPKAMLGAADAIVWKRGKSTSYAVRFDPVRAFIVRIWTMFVATSSRDGTAARLLIGEQRGAALQPDLAEILMAEGLPPGRRVRRAAQGIARRVSADPRPAVTSVKVTANEIDIASRATGDETRRRSRAEARAPLASRRRDAGRRLHRAAARPRRPRSPRRRRTSTSSSSGGGSIALYDVDTGTLLPRPFMAVVVPADEQHRAALGKYDQRHRAGRPDREHRRRDRWSPSTATACALYLKDASVPAMPGRRTAGRSGSTRRGSSRSCGRSGDNPALRFADAAAPPRRARPPPLDGRPGAGPNRSRPRRRRPAGSRSCACALHRNRFVPSAGLRGHLLARPSCAQPHHDTEVIDFKTIDEHGPQTYHATFDVAVDELERDELASVGDRDHRRERADRATWRPSTSPTAR